MSTPTAPFTDPTQIRPLYACPHRLGQRTGALHRAKITGADAAATIAALALTVNPGPGRLADIGCGRGTTTARLARQHPAAAVVAIDQSPALLAVLRNRLRAQDRHVALVAADFHHLPIAATSIDLAVAAFCLYHSPQPAEAAAEIARCLRPGAHLIATTKSADSYHAIDHLIAQSGLDPEAAQRPTLYETFHSGNAEREVTAAGLLVRRRIDQEHTFRYTSLTHLAEYVATCPKYQLPDELAKHPARLAVALRRRLPDTPVTTTSTVTYLVAQRP